MSSPALRFQKRPVQIEAIQFDGTAEVSESILKWAGTPPVRLVIDPGSGMCCGIEVETLTGTMIASRGDWIIRGLAGEFYPCHVDVFETTYEPVYDPERDPAQLALFPRADVE